MNGKNLNKLLVVFGIIIFVISSNPFGVFAAQIEEGTFDVQSEHIFTLLDNLPIAIDDLFSLDNYTEFEAMLDKVEDGVSFWPIRPYGTFFGHGHIEGLPRMDFCPHKLHVEIRAPLDGFGSFWGAGDGTVDWINGIECVIDCGIILDIGNECALHIGHIDMVKTIWDEINSTGSASISKGELIGFTTDAAPYSIADFAYTYNDVRIPPYNAYTPKLQGKVDMMYSFLYERAKLNGFYPRARMINDMFIHKDDEFWGNWQYKTGPFDSYIEEGEWVGRKDFAFFTFLNREFTTPETYWKNEYNKNYNLTNNILGYGGNPYLPGTTPGFYATGFGHILLVEGDNTSGIFEMRHQYDSSTNSDYGKFEIIVNSSSIIGDELQLEFFPTLVEAQGDFTVNASTYERIHTTTIDDIWIPPSEPTNGVTVFIYPTILGIIIISLITHKKKK